MHTNTCSVRFVRASQKLKAYKGPSIECNLKGKYAQRKWQSVQYTCWFLQHKFNSEQRDSWLPFFQNKDVKPDMGDTFLMAINALQQGCQTKNKKGKCIK